MYKKLLAVSLGLGLFMTNAVSAFAMEVSETETVDTTTGTVVEETIEEAVQKGGGMAESYYDPYYSNISFSIYLTSTATPSKINLSGDYSVAGAESREAAMKDLKAALSQAQKSLSAYGKVTMLSMNAYEDYVYDSMGNSSTGGTYSGYLSIRLELSNLGSLEMAKNALTSLNFSYWVDATLDEEQKIDIESSLSAKLSSLIGKKKSVYEKIIGEKLGKISSLYIDTWADGSMYNSETGLVPVTVTATVGYSIQ